jgi:hypothetical protein
MLVTSRHSTSNSIMLRIKHTLFNPKVTFYPYNTFKDYVSLVNNKCYVAVRSLFAGKTIIADLVHDSTKVVVLG